MATEIKMPQLGLTMVEGTVGKWHKKIGDTVKIEDVLVEIQTDKLTSEILSEVEGELLAIMAEEGAELPVQAVLCVIGQPGEKIAAAPAAAPAPAAAVPVAASTAAATAATASSSQADGRVRISPLARKIAAQKGINITTLTGTGPGGRILQRDVLNAPVAAAVAAPVAPAASAPVVSSGTERRERLTPMRKIVAERMFQSHSEIPVVTQVMKCDVTELMAFAKQINENREKRFSINDLVLKAVAKALAANKHILTSLDGTDIVYHEDVNIGMAVALEEGLIVPVIKDADKLSLEAISAKARDLATRARSGGLDMDDYQGATFSVSNLGMFGVESFTPIINQPNAAILGVGCIDDELAVEGESIVVRKKMRLSMTYDHRLMDGAVAARFKQAVKKLLESPMDIVL